MCFKCAQKASGVCHARQHSVSVAMFGSAVLQTSGAPPRECTELPPDVELEDLQLPPMDDGPCAVSSGSRSCVPLPADDPGMTEDQIEAPRPRLRLKVPSDVRDETCCKLHCMVKTTHPPEFVRKLADLRSPLENSNLEKQNLILFNLAKGAWDHSPHDKVSHVSVFQNPTFGSIPAPLHHPPARPPVHPAQATHLPTCSPTRLLVNSPTTIPPATHFPPLAHQCW